MALRYRARRRLRRLWQISNKQRVLLAEAILWLIVARLGLVVVPFRSIARQLGDFVSPIDKPGIPMNQTNAGEMELARTIGWAVTRAARYVPFRAVCLPQAIAAKVMLRRRKIGGVLHFGVRKSDKPKKSIDAHAWLDAAGVEVTGYPIAHQFTEIARFV